MFITYFERINYERHKKTGQPVHKAKIARFYNPAIDYVIILLPVLRSPPVLLVLLREPQGLPVLLQLRVLPVLLLQEPQGLPVLQVPLLQEPQELPVLPLS